MGYELRLHIVQDYTHDLKTLNAISTPQAETTQRESIDFLRTYGLAGRELAMFDLSNPGYDSKIYAMTQEAQKEAKEVFEKTGIRRALYTDVLIEEGTDYARITSDKYNDDPLGARPLREVYAALMDDYAASFKDYGNGRGYRRFYIATELIRAILDTFEQETSVSNDRLMVVFYGH